MIHAIVLAAGISRRMGTQKLLLPWDGRTVIERVVGEMAAGCDGHIAVVAREGSGIAKALADTADGRVQIVFNPNTDADMLSSARCGLRALDEDCEGYLVALGDQPTVSAGLIQRMIAAFGASRSGSRGIVIPTHNGRRGHPILFTSRYRADVLTQFDGVGLRGLAASHANDVYELAESDPTILTDLDYPEDYRRATRNIKGQ